MMRKLFSSQSSQSSSSDSPCQRRRKHSSLTHPPSPSDKTFSQKRSASMSSHLVTPNGFDPTLSQHSMNPPPPHSMSSSSNVTIVNLRPYPPSMYSSPYHYYPPPQSFRPYPRHYIPSPVPSNSHYHYPAHYSQPDQNADIRKRARRQAAGNLVSGLFGSDNTASPNPTAGANPTGRKSTAQPRPSIKVPPRGIGPVYEPNYNDVLCGRGGRINAHPGNVQFRELVQDRKKDYLAKETKKLEKAHIAASLVQLVRDMKPSGRFLKEDPDGSWYDIGDAKAIKKVGQALREDAPDIRHEINPSDDEDGAIEGDAEMQKPVSPFNTTEMKPVTNDSEGLSPRVNAKPLTVSGRGGAKAAAGFSSPAGKQSNNNTSHYQPIAYQTLSPPPSYQPILPQQPHHQQTIARGRQLLPSNIRPGKSSGFSGAAAAAMNNIDEDNDLFEIPPARDIAFGRTFHPADAPHAKKAGNDDDRDSSMISGLSGPTVLSGMSGISAITDPISALSGNEQSKAFHFIHPNQPQQFAVGTRQVQTPATRANQLELLRQQWAASRRSGDSNSQPAATAQVLDNKHSLRVSSLSAGRMSAAFNDSNMSFGVADNSWPDNSLAGGGIRDDNGSILSGLSAMQSVTMNSVFTMPHSLTGPSPTSTHYPGDLMSTSVLPQHREDDAASSGSSNSEMYARNLANLMPFRSYTRIPQSGASIRSGGLDSLPSVSASIMSDLSDTLIALDLAEPMI